MNEEIRQKEGIRTNLQYRRYLQGNADPITKYNLTIAQSRVTTQTFATNDDSTARTPYLYGATQQQPFLPPQQRFGDLKESYLAQPH